MAEDAKSRRANGETVPVLICGGGPVGLALAAELGHQRVQCSLWSKAWYRSGSEIEPTDHANNGVLLLLGHCRAGKKSRLAETHPCDFVYETSLTGFELYRQKYPSYMQAAGA